MSDAINEALASCPLLPVHDLLRRGVTRGAIQSAEARGVLARPARGFVCDPAVAQHPRMDEVVAAVMTGGIVSRRTAAFRHGLSEDMDGMIEVLVPNESTRAPASLPVTILRSRSAEAFSVGVVRETVLGHEVRVTDEPRTVVDYYRTGMPRQDVMHVLHAFLARDGEGGLLTTAMAFGWKRNVVAVLERDIESYLMAARSAPGL